MISKPNAAPLWFVAFLVCTSFSTALRFRPEGLSHRKLAQQTPPCPSIKDVLEQYRLTELQSALDTAQLTSMISAPGQRSTIFAPSNEAMQQFIRENPSILQAPLALSNILKFHILEGTDLRISGLGDRHYFQSALGVASDCGNSRLRVDNRFGAVFAVGLGSVARVTRRDVPACGGMVHVIDKVLLPCKTIQISPGSDIPESIKMESGFLEAYDGMQPASTPASTPPVQQSAAVPPPAQDAVNQAVPPAVPVPTPSSTPVEPDADVCSPSYQLPRQNELSILFEAVRVVGLDSNKYTGPFTVFAPTNRAFENLFASLGISKEQFFADKERLKHIILFHVLEASEKRSTDLDHWERLTTMASRTGYTQCRQTDVMFVKRQGGSSLMASNGESVISSADVKMCNGVVHILDKVLLPCRI